MTLNEYKYQNKLTIIQLAELLDVSEASIQRYLDGFPARPSAHKKMRELGIEHEGTRYGKQIKDDDVAVLPKKEVKEVKKKAKSQFNSKLLKEFQVVAIKEFGNTIVSKKYKDKDIINEFAKFGLNVKLQDFCDKTHSGWDTHYVVTLVGVKS